MNWYSGSQNPYKSVSANVPALIFVLSVPMSRM